ncbi:MAG: hypothetical protein ACRD3Q_09310 [Terriglobales bacterium]
MDLPEYYSKQFDRTLDIINESEKIVSRLALARTALLVVATLFLAAYVQQLDAIHSLRVALQNSLATNELGYTVYGLLSKHQKIQRQTFVPDEVATSLITLIGKLQVFLGDKITLETQGGKKVSDVLDLATKKPEHIKLENSYLPDLTIPVSYSLLSLTTFVATVTCAFYLHYKKRRLQNLVRQAERLYRNMAVRVGDRDTPCHAITRGVAQDISITALVGRILLRRTRKGDIQVRSFHMDSSPYRFLNDVLAFLLSVRLLDLTAHILISEANLPVSWCSELPTMILLVGVPSLLLLELNRYFERETRDETVPQSLSRGAGDII